MSARLPNASAKPRDTIPGSFYLFDFRLDKLTDNPKDLYGRGQGEIVDYQGRHEIYKWGEEPYPTHCIRFFPDKPGDFITFRIHIAQALEDQEYQYEVVSSCANFYNEGIYQLEINGKVVGEPHDCYQLTKWTHGVWPVKTGDYKITYRYVGKNKKSKGKVLNIVSLDFL